MELRKMTNHQVAKRMYDYVIRLQTLSNQVSDILNHNKKESNIDIIREEYKFLKNAIKEDAHYMSLLRNQKNDNTVLQKQFEWVIGEASAYGFTSSTNSKIDFQFFSSIEEAIYKLTKHTTIEEWKRLSEEGNK